MIIMNSSVCTDDIALLTIKLRSSTIPCIALKPFISDMNPRPAAQSVIMAENPVNDMDDE